uniref:G-protein coupled receptors family 1 profile domain-containing protein n=1 Tax=Meloidogyne enterolobii TaxID=390850 RepID=A0A6V7TRV6_MELEN|nr:unnamed protein product [Meloidogyne enterolobii]
MNNSTTLPAIFLAYQTPGFYLPLFLPALSLTIPATIGIILNSSVCYITWKYWGKYTTFKSKTSILLAINSFLEIGHQSGHFVFFFISLTGINFIPVSLAIKMQGHSVVCANIVNIMFLTMSVDRVIAVASPIFYANINFRSYIFLHILPIFTLSVFIFYQILSKIGAHPDFPVTGNLADIFGITSIIDARLIYIPLLLTSILLHIIVGFLVKYKGDLANEKLRKLFRSLSLIVFVNIGGYFIFNVIYFLILAFLPISPEMIWYLSGYLAVILNISAAVNAPILYFNSSDYNTAYKKEYGIIKLKLIKNNTVDNSIVLYK